MLKKRIIALLLSTAAVLSAVVFFNAIWQKNECEERPFGLFEIFNYSQGMNEESEEKLVKQISFSGSGRCTVSRKRPSIELHNPRENSVNMVFTVSDQTTGEIIARTTSVAPGKYAYIDVVSFYKTSGTYCINIDTSTEDAETGQELNGMHQEMEVTIQ